MPGGRGDLCPSTFQHRGGRGEDGGTRAQAGFRERRGRGGSRGLGRCRCTSTVAPNVSQPLLGAHAVTGGPL